MAITALHSAATGLSALSTNLDIVANNLANLNTTGYKASRANFEDLLYVEKQQPGVENLNGDERPIGLYVGLGVRVSGTQLDFTQGSPVNTGRDLDVTIDGPGFFQVLVTDQRAPNGIAYTRNGQFSVNSEGELVLANDEGQRLEPNITIPADISGPVSILRDGSVWVQQQGSAEPTQIGTIEIAAFVNPQGLSQIGNNLYAETAASGPPITGEPDTDGRGGLIQQHLEGSNVNPTNELIELIKTQRALEMNSQSIRTADEVLQAIAQLRR